MGLNLTRRIITALLPNDYREHVLGDLEERGFRMRDVVSVLPRVWLSALRRVNFPWHHAVWYGVLGLTIASMTGMPYGVASIVVSAFALVGLLVPDVPASLSVLSVSEQHKFLERARKREFLERARNQARWGFPQIALLPSVNHIASYLWPSITKFQQIWFAILWTILFVALGQIRARRLQQELNSLKIPISPYEPIPPPNPNSIS